MAERDKDKRIPENGEPDVAGAGEPEVSEDAERTKPHTEDPQLEDVQALDEEAGPQKRSQTTDTLSEEDVDALKAELETARQEAADAREQALRQAAEAQNVRHRAEKDVEKARKFALERFAGDLLAIVDNLERALDAAGAAEGDNVKPIVEGIELTHRSFLDVLAKHNIEQVDPEGEPFDPQFHEAMTMVPDPEVEPNTVIEVMQKGYTLNGRLLRAAMVVVSKAPQ